LGSGSAAEHVGGTSNYEYFLEAPVELLPVTIDDELSGQRALLFAVSLSKLPLNEVDGLVLHLHESSHLDVSGIAIIVRIYSTLQSRGKVLYLVGVSEAVSRALSRLGLDGLVNVPKTAQRPPKETDPTLSALATRDYAAVTDLS
jgi:anti-anti-sigma factor